MFVARIPPGSLMANDPVGSRRRQSHRTPRPGLARRVAHTLSRGRPRD